LWCAIQGVGLLLILRLALELLIGLLTILAIMLSLVTDHLTARMQDIIAILADAVYVIADRGEFAGFERTLLRFQYLFETILRQLIILQMIRLVLI